MSPILDRIGWTLLHSLWEDALVWLLLTAVLAIFRPRSAAVRCGLGGWALAAAVLAPVVTFTARTSKEAWVVHAPALSSVHGAEADNSSGSPSETVSTGGAELPPPLKPAFPNNPLSPWLAIGWLAGLLFGAVRLGLRARQLAALTQAAHTVPVEPDDEIAERLRRLCERWQMTRPVRLLRSAWVQVPATFGWWRPVILWPVAQWTGLSSLQIEALLAHELAHIRRHDYLINLIQEAAAVVLFYHPAIYAINRLIRLEREKACDDIAVGLVHDPIGYAEALVQLESARSLALVQSAAGPDGSLAARISRLLGGGDELSAGKRLLARPILICVGVGLLALLSLPFVTEKVVSAAEREAAIRSAVVAEGTSFPVGQKMEVSGEVFDPSGARVPDGNVILLSQSDRWVETSSAQIRQGKFAATIQAGQLTVRVADKHFAPLTAGPVSPSGNPVGIRGLRLQLERGLPVRLMMIDGSGSPVAGVRVVGHAVRQGEHPSMWSDVEFSPSGSDGLVNCGFLAKEYELSLVARGAGFEEDERAIPAPAQSMDTPRWQLKAALPAWVTVLDAGTGSPVGAVRVTRAAIIRPNFVDMKDGASILTQNENGRAMLNSLHTGWDYLFRFEKVGFAPLHAHVKAGDRLTLRLGRGIRIAGTILDRPSKNLVMRCWGEIELTLPSGGGATDQTPTQTIHLAPNVINQHFEFEHVPAGRIRLALGDRTYTYDLTVSRTDLQLTGIPESDSHRVVEVTFKSSETPPRGSVRADYRPASTRNWFGQQTDLLIVDGCAKADVAHRSDETRGSLSIQPIGMIGAWFDPITLFVPDGEKPLRLTVDTKPAGAIHALMREMDGTVARDVTIDCLMDTPWPDRFSFNYSLDRAEKTFTPLPFGRRYWLLAWSGTNITISGGVNVNAGNPFPTVEFTRKRGRRVSGRIVNGDGKGVPGLPLTLNYQPFSHYGYALGGPMTDANGEFSLASVNFDGPGSYKLEVAGSPSPSFQTDGDWPISSWRTSGLVFRVKELAHR